MCDNEDTIEDDEPFYEPEECECGEAAGEMDWENGCWNCPTCGAPQ